MAKAKPVELEAQTPYAEAAARTVRVRSAELFEHAGRVLDTDDIEGVHDMRVATRRLRAALEVFQPCFEPKAFEEVLRDVKRLADALGARRDPDVQLGEMEALAERLAVEGTAGVAALLAELRAEQARGNAVLAKVLRKARKSDLAGRLAALADGAVS